MLQAIETIYGGYRFRSRLEARWAVFFDHLGVPYEYEREAYDLDGVYYLPDFWLPEQEYWIEIKGRTPSAEETQKAQLLARHSTNDVYLFVGPPDVPIIPLLAYIWFDAPDPAGERWFDDEGNYAVAIKQSREEGWFAPCTPVWMVEDVKSYIGLAAGMRDLGAIDHERLNAACAAARSERFASRRC
jgi:hypothetical protein